MAGPNTILLKVNRLSDRAGEGRAAGTITPGDIIVQGSAGTWTRNGTAAALLGVKVALEDSFQGKTIDNDYASGDLVFFHHCQKGDEIYAFVAAAATAVVIGDKLEADAAGGFRKLASGTPIGEALEALDNSGGGAKARLRVRVL